MAAAAPPTPTGAAAPGAGGASTGGRAHALPPSPNATPTNSSVASTPLPPSLSLPLLDVADRAGTPLGLFLDLAGDSTLATTNATNATNATIATGDNESRATGPSTTNTHTDITNTTYTRQASIPHTLRDSSGVSQIPDPRPRASAQGTQGYVQGLANAVNTSASFSPQAPRSPNPSTTCASANARGQHRSQQHEMPPNGVARASSRGRAPNAAGSVTGSGTASSPVDQDADGAEQRRPSTSTSTRPDPTTPLHTGTVQPEIKIAHPKPKPIVRTSSIGPAGKPSSATRSASPSDNIAQLEATAERLSMTSSIDHAIRDLHGQLKRSDSTRSSILAASVKAATAGASSDDNLESTASASGQLTRHLSTSSSIVSTNIAARYGGYSPAAYIMSPSNSLTSRLRSGSANSTGRPEPEFDSIGVRNGPGKSSVRSVRSTKMSLADISESEPTSLTQHALDEADASPRIEDEVDDTMGYSGEKYAAGMPNTDAFHQMLDDSFAAPDPAMAKPDIGEIPGWRPIAQGNPTERSPSLRSQNTLEQGADAFVDFDGVHWEPSAEDMEPPAEFEPESVEHEPPIPRQGGRNLARPTSYFDMESGQQMLYYPARVPAMLNLPPKLSAKPNAAERNKRRSQVMSAMLKGNTQLGSAASNSPAGSPEITRESWLPDPVASHRDSFALLSQDNLPNAKTQSTKGPDSTIRTVSEPDGASGGLRRPQRLSKMEPGKRTSKASQDMLKPQLRASAFFDMPSSSPEVQIKDGSAMATLEGILDASAHAPVNAFTDHVIAGKLGPEVYGREKKKHKSRPSVMSLGPNPESAELAPKKRSSFMWLNKRTSSYNSDDRSRSKSMASMPGLGTVNAKVAESETDALTSSIDGDYVRPADDDLHPQSDEDDSEDGYDYQGAPTTLLGELQLRKQEQKHRTQKQYDAVANGTQATLLEMDTVAETQRKFRSGQRVNLAWEDEASHFDQNGADDEDVPLAIIAAMHQGAKNKADLQRPIGLMERRDIEDNEPLSQRRARLQGRVSMPSLLHTRQSMMSLSGPRRLGATSPHTGMVKTPEPEVEEIDGETLFDRKRRMGGQDGEEELPKARPVSSSFSAELLSQFGDLDDAKVKSADMKGRSTPMPDGVEETLGQRRKRLQAEREAREREMSYSNLIGDDGQPTGGRRMSMANVLSAHPKRDPDVRRRDEQRRAEEQMNAARNRDSKMAAMRRAMPTNLPAPTLNRASGFMGGAYNDGMAGSTNAPQSVRPNLGGRSNSAIALQQPAMGGYGGMGMPMQQGYGGSNMGGYVDGPMPGYAGSNMGGYAGSPMPGYAGTNMGGYAMSGMNGMSGVASGYGYGGGMVPQGNMMQGVPNGRSENMIERWRQSVLH